MSGRPLDHGLQLRDFAAAIIAVAAVLSPEEQIRVTINSVPHRPFTRCTAVQCSRSPTRLNADRCGAACVQPCSAADAVERFVSERMRSCGRLRNDHFRQSAVHSSMLPHLGRIRHTTKAVFDERNRFGSLPAARPPGGRQSTAFAFDTYRCFGEVRAARLKSMPSHRPCSLHLCGRLSRRACPSAASAPLILA